jgi:hypothetical protein
LDKVAQPFDYIVERALKDWKQVLEASVTKGQATDWGEYKYLCGQISGIQFAMDSLKDARRRAGLDEDGRGFGIWPNEDPE